MAAGVVVRDVPIAESERPALEEFEAGWIHLGVAKGIDELRVGGVRRAPRDFRGRSRGNIPVDGLRADGYLTDLRTLTRRAEVTRTESRVRGSRSSVRRVREARCFSARAPLPRPREGDGRNILAHSREMFFGVAGVPIGGGRAGEVYRSPFRCLRTAARTSFVIRGTGIGRSNRKWRDDLPDACAATSSRYSVRYSGRV